MFTSRIRSVKPELFSHEGLYEAEVRYKLPLRLAFIALFGCCDREGRFRWQPRRLKLDMLPYDDVDIAAVLNAFIECGFIKKYEHEGEVYGCIPSWSRHQKINHREGDSELLFEPFEQNSYIFLVCFLFYSVASHIDLQKILMNSKPLNSSCAWVHDEVQMWRKKLCPMHDFDNQRSYLCVILLI